ncbi:kelch-like protein 17 [Anneissia japonica]|uniref:kelch-like protein 17 n=1 Tax=Anneissia japonica TaxID=1529436 RepID=UPI00142578EE|nr:kelch-like protein 17 [Anneissia japonica]XP_033104587.1 kelch-like protein 17 [Anneissia japonica]XP_033104588.1 kelch-like protein 17 [Anneissia japonica]
MPKKLDDGCLLHHSAKHTNEAFIAMDKMRHSGVLCDITLKVEGQNINGHKLVLASCSPYFHAMFTNNMSECNRSAVTLHDIDAEAVAKLIQFAYTSEIIISDKNVQSLLPAANLLQLHSVRDACSKYLLSQLEPSNCLGIRRFADAHACQDLFRYSQEFVLRNFNEVVNSEEYIQLSLTEVEELMSNEEVNIANEEDIFNAVMLWIRHDLQERKQCIGKLLRHVRLPLLTRDFLVLNVEKDEIVHTSPECKDLLIEAMKYHLLPEQRASLQSVRTRQRQNTKMVTVLFSVGGGSLFAIHNECECFDPRHDSWFNIAPMNFRRARLGVAAASRCIYAVGGYDGSGDLSVVECYKPKLNTWTECASMGTRRSCLGVAVLNGLLYAVGGYDGASCLNSAERYDPLTNAWTSIAAMSTRRRYVKLAVLDDFLWAVGGYDGSTHLSSVEKYDPKTNTWTQIANMNNRRSSMGVAVIEDVLYVVGGNDGASCLNSAERFNQDINMWEPVTPMTTRRSTHDAVSLNSHLYVIGGNDGSSSLNSVERYNPLTRRWKVLSSMSSRRSSVGVTAAEILPASENKVD